MPKAAIHPQRTAFQNSSCDKPKNCGHSNIGQLTRFDGSLEGLKVKIKVNKKPRKFCRVDEDKRKPTVINKFLFLFKYQIPKVYVLDFNKRKKK